MFRNNVLKIFFIMLGVVWSFTEASFSVAGTRVFQGNFSANDEYGNMSVDIPFSVADNTAVYLEFLSECTSQDKAYMEFYTSWGGRMTWANTTDGLKERPGVIASEIVQPYGPFPLTAGNYGVRLYCLGEEWDSTMAVGYRLTVTSNIAITSQFSRDAEPNDTEAHPIPVVGNTSVDGWLGLAGYEVLKDVQCAAGIGGDSFCGMDVVDYFDVRVAPDTKFKIKLEYDSIFSKINRPDWYKSYDDMRVNIEYVMDGHTHFVADLGTWTNSGDLSVELNSYEGGIFRLSVYGLYYRDETQMRTTKLPNITYGGYRVTVVVDEVPEPEELLVTVREVSWQKSRVRDYDSNSGYRIIHLLDINFDVENKYNETQTIENIAYVDIPVIQYIPGVTTTNPRDVLISSYTTGACQLGRIDWDEFCYKKSNVDGWCQKNTYFSAWSASSSISAHSKNNFTLSIPVTAAQYYNFDESFQVVTVATKRTTVPDLEACYRHGLSFWPARAFIPAVNLLLND